MSHFRIDLLGQGRCKSHHQESGAQLTTQASGAAGSKPTQFSSTDLVAVALGTCIGSSVEAVAIREGLDRNHFWLEVEKEMEHSPLRIAFMKVVIRIDQPVSEVTLRKLSRAANACPVKKALNDSVEVLVSIEPSGKSGLA